MKTTKRRRVWVNSTNDGLHEENAYWSLDDALDQGATYHVEVAIPFVEYRRGDVVLSREDVALRLLDEALSLGRPALAAEMELRELLRGGR